MLVHSIWPESVSLKAFTNPPWRLPICSYSLGYSNYKMNEISKRPIAEPISWSADDILSERGFLWAKVYNTDTRLPSPRRIAPRYSTISRT